MECLICSTSPTKYRLQTGLSIDKKLHVITTRVLCKDQKSLPLVLPLASEVLLATLLVKILLMESYGTEIY